MWSRWRRACSESSSAAAWRTQTIIQAATNPPQRQPTLPRHSRQPGSRPTPRPCPRVPCPPPLRTCGTPSKKAPIPRASRHRKQTPLLARSNRSNPTRPPFPALIDNPSKRPPRHPSSPSPKNILTHPPAVPIQILSKMQNFHLSKMQNYTRAADRQGWGAKVPSRSVRRLLSSEAKG